MKLKEKREWNKMWGNAGLNEYELKSKVMLLLFNSPTGLPPNTIYIEIFGTASGKILEDNLNRVFTELSYNELIQKEQNMGYILSGKGLKSCKFPVKFFRKYPYETWFWLNKLDLLFTKYLPIIFSAAALLISYLTFLFAIQNKK